MKIGIYSDLHISRTSSILPLYYGDSKYTTRLQMIIDTGKWMYKIFKNKNVDFIVNCGDTLDTSTVRAEELSALKEFYSYSTGVQEYHIVGNHEMADGNGKFYSTTLIDNLDYVNIIDEPKKLKINDKLSIAFLPYMKAENIQYSDLEKINADILFSHIDIKGSALRPDYILDTGVEPEYLADNFSVTINGHLHTPEVIETSHNKVVNIGSISSISFVDSNSYIPSVCIFDTDTMKYERYNNPYSILFRRFNVDDVSTFLDDIRKLKSNYRYVLNVLCPFDIKEEIKSIINGTKNVIASRVTVVSNKELADFKTNSDIDIHRLVSMDIKEEFINFLKQNSTLLNAPVDEYIEILNNY